MATETVTRVAPPVALIPPLRVAVERFLARSRFAARTRESYAQDLAPLLAHVGDQIVATALTHAAAAAYLAAQEPLAASTYNRRYAALRSLSVGARPRATSLTTRSSAWSVAPRRAVVRAPWTRSGSRRCCVASAPRAIAPSSG
jgi:hypothetical protein